MRRSLKCLSRSLRSICKKLHRSAIPSPSSRRTRRIPELEALEDRLVPAIVFGDPGVRTVETGNTGPVIANAHVELVFWGTGWTSAQKATAQKDIGSILSGPYLSSLSQYGVGAATLNGVVPVTDSNPPSVATPNAVDTMLQAKMTDGTLPSPASDSHLLYLVLPQLGTGGSDGGSPPQGIGGSHAYDTFNGTNFHFGWCTNLNEDNLTNKIGHELVEALTDPEGPAMASLPSNPAVLLDDPSATDPSGQDPDLEVEDNQPFTYRLSGVQVESYWSATDNHFIVPTGQAQNFFVTGTDNNGLNGTLTVNGDQLGANFNDVITIDEAPGGGVLVTLNGETAQFDAGQITSVIVNTGGGNDVVNVERTAPGESLTINLGSGTDTVNISPTAKSLTTIQGTVTINGHPGADTLTLNDQHASFFEVWNVAGSSISRSGAAAINYSNINNLVLNAGFGNNFFTLSPTAQNVDELPSSVVSLFGSSNASISINGGSGTNTLTIDDQNNPVASAWAVSGTNVTRSHRLGSGLILGTVSTSINYTNVANLVIHAGKGNNTITLSPAKQDLAELPGTTAFPVEIGGTGGSLFIDGGTGASTLVLDDQSISFASSWQVTGQTISRSFSDKLGLRFESVSTLVNYSHMANLVLNTGAGNSTVTLSPTKENLDELPSGFSSRFGTSTDTITVNGGSGTNTLIVNDQNNPLASSWHVTGGNITRTHRAGGILFASVWSSIDYSHMTNVVLHAGKGNDSFTLSPTAKDLDELPGTNVLPQLLPFPATSLTIDGGGGSNSMVFDDQNNAFNSVWNVTSSNVSRSYSRSVGLFHEGVSFSVAYSNVTNLTLNGGKGNNTFVIAGTPAGSQVTVNGGAGSNKLTTDNANHTFHVTGHDAGSVANVAFTNIGSLTGGAGMDVFQFAAAGLLDGAIDGGGGGDWLDYSAFGAPVTVNLATGAATAVTGGVSNIQNVIGSAANDTLTGNALGNILIGGAGTNVINGGSGRSLLIGGTGSSVLDGGANDDILIAGTSTLSETALMAVLKEWQRTDKTYAQRIADLRKGGGLNGSSTLVLGKTVLDNDKASLLTGGPGQDWFFADVGHSGTTDLITDRVTKGPLAEAVN